MKHFFAGIGEIKLVGYLLYICHRFGTEFCENSVIYFGSYICKYVNYCSNLSDFSIKNSLDLNCI
ncbi:Uncharacterised protein [Streptococcus pneumoniae]|nr:Uncharacterised protein [Streptococcus pneumoniae]CEY42732.1 Uncharacterised protein [Streptococcus pneumoniae]CEY51282.1 Uncharacterised protein [Streptococcus pneumoniae]CEZ02497.1 Uncharacterised protein [Streptococcus pneumoniae]CJL19414.1 Uncharacterised protein [Streptococcus pneumoniae]